jgi:hypothetical protein
VLSIPRRQRQDKEYSARQHMGLLLKREPEPARPVPHRQNGIYIDSNSGATIYGKGGLKAREPAPEPEPARPPPFMKKSAHVNRPILESREPARSPPSLAHVNRPASNVFHHTHGGDLESRAPEPEYGQKGAYIQPPNWSNHLFRP